MAKKDYYKTLGVDKNATEKEIKQAFRKQAKQWHPDANRDNPNAEAKFKEVNEAYEVLSDATKRSTYDQFGSVNPQDFGFGGAPGAGGRYTYTTTGDEAGGTPFGDIFEQFFGGARNSRRGRGTASQNPFGDFGGATSSRQGGQDIEQPVSISLKEAFNGGVRIVTKGERKLRVNIPKGATDGTRIRLAGEGGEGFGGGPNGDLYLVVQLEDDPQFKRTGDDLTVEVKVDMFTAMLGGEVEVPTLDRSLKLRIPAGTQSGKRIRLKGKGMPNVKQQEQFGDLYARILITVPENLNDSQRTLVEGWRDQLNA
ncbi:MAG: J domain-containing protein [Chloroflexi bacterium]|nr:J domain-containing protein [Chloroflexota bacterium]MCC6891955.1 J domain-containing protein [Anaerolineae bacterium]